MNRQATEQARDPRPVPAAAPERFETVIVGGGQAGLAVGYHLARRGRSFVILDANQRVGDAWRQTLGLAAPVHPGPLRRVAGDALPRPSLVLPHQGRGRRLPGGLRRAVRPAGSHRRPRGPAVQGRGPVRAGRRRPPVSGRPRGGGIGAYQRPRIPAFAAELDPGILQLDPSRYRNPSQLPGGGVLVVGAGNSGAEIAVEVSRTHPTWLSGPDTGHIPVRAGSRWDRLVHPAVLVVRLAGADRADPDRSQGPTQGPDHDRAAGAGAAQGSRRRRGQAGAEDRRGAGRLCRCWRTGASWTWPRCSGAPGSDPTSPGSTSRSSTRTAPRHTTAASSGPSPACTSWGYGSCRRSPPRCSAGSAATPTTSPSRSPPATPTASRRRRSRPQRDTPANVVRAELPAPKALKGSLGAALFGGFASAGVPE